MEKETKRELPEAFVEKMKKLLGSDAESFFKSYDAERKFGLRVNPLKQKSGEMPEEGEPLGDYLKGLARVPWAEEGFYYEADMRPGRHPFHEAGAYYIQEPSAMSVAEALSPKPGEQILDLCAAPGGKSTHLAGKMGGHGLLVCNEIHPARAKILSQNIERLGVENAVVTNMDPFRLAPEFPEFFDGIVVDAPCSGEGMFRKDENARNEWSPDHVKQCAGLQDGILDCAAAMLKGGGRIVYSTCTFSPEENEQSIARFLERHPEFSVVQLDLVPEVMPCLMGLKVLRPGLHLGSAKKDRFEPSHALALALKKSDVRQSVEVGSEDLALRYLRGETLRAEDLEELNIPAKGWVLVTTGGMSLGFAKAAGGMLKNHYPKGLRIQGG